MFMCWDKLGFCLNCSAVRSWPSHAVSHIYCSFISRQFHGRLDPSAEIVFDGKLCNKAAHEPPINSKYKAARVSSVAPDYCNAGQYYTMDTAWHTGCYDCCLYQIEMTFPVMSENPWDWIGPHKDFAHLIVVTLPAGVQWAATSPLARGICHRTSSLISLLLLI